MGMINLGMETLVKFIKRFMSETFAWIKIGVIPSSHFAISFFDSMPDESERVQKNVENNVQDFVYLLCDNGN